jgi:hypothetical protein
MMYETESARLNLYDKIRGFVRLLLFLCLGLSLGSYFLRERFESFDQQQKMALWASFIISTLISGSISYVLKKARPSYIRKVYKDDEAAKAVIFDWCPFCLGLDTLVCPYAPALQKTSKRSWMHHGVKVGRVTRSRLHEPALARENPKLKRSLDESKRALAMLYQR